MKVLCRVQGRDLTERDIEQVRALIADHPSLSRNRISIELARSWNWYTPAGQIKDMAARTLMLKLDQRGWIVLPPVRRKASRRLPIPLELTLPFEEGAGAPIEGALRELTPLSFAVVSANHPAFSQQLARHHYIGYRGPVGENLAYRITDRSGRDLACALFGAAAWKVKARDQWIGWSQEVRQRRLSWVANNSRFLILPWVRVPHLASHILAKLTRRLAADWQAKYGHPLWLAETFVDRSRFRGTSYKAANWICAGQTQGRSRQDRDRTLRVPVKDVYLYPLVRDARHRLCQG
jgi:hypothetical protein